MRECREEVLLGTMTPFSSRMWAFSKDFVLEPRREGMTAMWERGRQGREELRKRKRRRRRRKKRKKRLEMEW